MLGKLIIGSDPQVRIISFGLEYLLSSGAYCWLSYLTFAYDLDSSLLMKVLASLCRLYSQSCFASSIFYYYFNICYLGTMQQQPQNSKVPLSKLLAKLSYSNIEEFLAADKIDKPGAIHMGYLRRDQLADTVFGVYEAVVSIEAKSLAQRRTMESSLTALRLDSFFGQKCRKFWPQRILPKRIYQITGKPNSGKTHFCYEIIRECLQTDIIVMCVDSGDNFTQEKLLHFLKDSPADKLNNVKIFQYKSLKKLGVLLYLLAQQIINEDKREEHPKVQKQYMILIDTLSYGLSKLDHESNYHYFLQFKKLLHQIVQKTNCSIVFTTQSRSTLYQTMHHRNDEQRFRNRHPRIWDGLSDTTVVLDSAVVIDNPDQFTLKRLRRACVTKSVEQDPFCHPQTVPFT